MSKRSSQNLYEVSETGNWNVAAPYVQLKIMRMLYFLDLYEEVATFGTSDILEELQMSPEHLTLNRIRGLKRMAKFLQMLINNVRFAIKSETDKKKLALDYEELMDVIEVIPLVEEKSINQRDKRVTLEINEKYFNAILNILVRIKTDINEPLNNNDLIFSTSEEFDPDKYKEEFIKEITETG